MTYNTLDNITSNGSSSDIVNILTLPTKDFPIFYPMILFAIFIILTLSLFFNQKGREGKGEFMSCLAVSSFATSLISLAMSVLGLIGSTTTVFVFAISIVFIVIFLLTKKDN